MSQRIFIKPTTFVVDGKPVARVVRKPTGTRLAPEGEEVTLETYWQRRLNEGEVEQTEPPASVVPEAAAAPAEAKATKPAK